MPIVLGFISKLFKYNSLIQVYGWETNTIAFIGFKQLKGFWMDGGHLPFLKFYEWMSTFIFIPHLILNMLYALCMNGFPLFTSSMLFLWFYLWFVHSWRHFISSYLRERISFAYIVRVRINLSFLTPLPFFMFSKYNSSMNGISFASFIRP